MMGARTILAALALALGLASCPAMAAASDPTPVCTGKDLLAELQRTNAAAYDAIVAKSHQYKNGEGLLWKIASPGREPSYLFGTIHATDDQAIAFARSMAKYIGHMRTVATELGEAMAPNLRWVIAAKAALRIVGNKADTASFVPSAEDREKLADVLRNLQMDPASALHMPPWLLISAFALPPCEVERQRDDLVTVDQTIVDIGRAMGTKIAALETIDEQLDALQTLDPTAAARQMVALARKPGLAEDMYATMLQLYHTQRIGMLFPVNESMVDSSELDRAADRTFTERILVKRNQVMIGRAKLLIDAGPVFIAVGALHLVGGDGLVELLRASGYTVTRVQ
jgi:uncharacterized protein YbaP (TraB family)